MADCASCASWMQHQSMVSTFCTQYSWSDEGPQSSAWWPGAAWGRGEVWSLELDLEHLLPASIPIGHAKAWGGVVLSSIAA